MRSLIFRDPPDHKRIRTHFQAAFTRKALSAPQPCIEALVDGYLDEIGGRRTFDAVASLAFRLPVDVICEMLGAPPADQARIRDWAGPFRAGLSLG